MLHTLRTQGLAQFKHEAHELYKIALPIFLAQIAAVGMGMTDTIMAGNYNKDDLAAIGIGAGLYGMTLITLIGVCVAVNPIMAKALGANEKHRLGEMGRQGLWLSLFIGVLGMVFMWGMIGIFKQQFNLGEYALTQMGEYIWYMALALPASILYRPLQAYAITLGKAKVISYISWFALIINVPLNYIFIYGKLGAPAMGGVGCGVATALASWISFVIMAIYIYKDRYLSSYGLWERFSLPDWGQLWQFVRLGVPIGFSFFIEIAMWTGMLFMAGKLTGNTETYVASQQIAINIGSFLYMIPQSLSMATITRIGYRLGQKNPIGARHVSATAIILAAVISAVAGLAVFAAQDVPGVYTKDAQVIALVTSLLPWVALVQMVDGMHCVASGALRGYQVATVPMLVQLVCFWGLGLVPAYYMGFSLGYGIIGFWWALLGSLTVASVIMLGLLNGYSGRLMRKAE